MYNNLYDACRFANKYSRVEFIYVFTGIRSTDW